MSDPINAFTPSWEYGTWEGHERLQLKLTREMPFEKKLEWLEGAHQLALTIQAQRRKLGLRTINTAGELEF